MKPEHERREIVGSYADAIAAHEQWPASYVTTAPGGRFACVALAPFEPVLSHEEALRRAPYEYGGRAWSCFGALLADRDRIIRMRAPLPEQGCDTGWDDGNQTWGPL